jgi:hypothetical protein
MEFCGADESGGAAFSRYCRTAADARFAETCSPSQMRSVNQGFPSHVGVRPQDPPADAVPEGPITSKALRESICQRDTPGIPKAWPNAWDASSARLLKQAGSRALGTSSASIAAAIRRTISSRASRNRQAPRCVHPMCCMSLPSDMERVGRGEGSGARGGQGLAGTIRSSATEGLRSTRRHGRVALRRSYWRSEEGRPPPCQWRFRRLKASTAVR